jgi:hypothetical protein
MNKILVGTILVIGLPVVFLKFGQQAGAALLFLLGIVIFSDSLWSWRYEAALRARGREAVISPASDTYTKITKVRSGSEKIRAHVTFRTAEGQEVTEETELPPGVLEKFTRGERVTVTYLPGKPSYYRFNPWHPSAPSDVTFGIVIMAIGAVWVAVKRQTTKKADVG